MRVLVDTSAWVDYLNGQSTPAAEALATILAGSDDVCTCGIVVAEVFQGLRREAGRDRLADLFREMRFLEPSGIDLYFKAAELYRHLRHRGITIRSTIDCLVAVMAEDAECYVLARDRDMDRILESGLVGTRGWPG
jgi:predicted nucleic acid-binding protein